VPLPASESGKQRNARRSLLQQAWDAVVSRFGAGFASGASDCSNGSEESDFSWGMRSPRQPRSLPELLSSEQQSELIEAGSGYQADVSDNTDTFWGFAVTGLEPSSIQYTPDASSPESDDAGSSDSDSKARCQTPVTSPSPPPATSKLAIVNERLAKLRCTIDRHRQALHTGVTHFYGEYMAESARLAQLERTLQDVQQDVEDLCSRHL